MKKFAPIFLIAVYAFSTTGISIRGFYCCEKLQSVKLTLADYAKDKDGCCKTKYQSFKIKDAHAASDVTAIPVSHLAFTHILNHSFQESDFTHEKNNHFVNIHAPPLFGATPVYISNCVFRI